MRGERIEDEEYTLIRADGSTRTLLTSATALQAENGPIVGAVMVSLDITERKRAEEQRHLLINELNHRVKNTLATVQSIARQSLRGATSMAEAREALSDRVVALAKAHDLLTRESWEGAELQEIVLGVVNAHGGRERFAVNGPPVWLTPTLCLSLALALHELATNAMKYGALSAEGGSVAIDWEVMEPLGEARLRLRWIERGGPRVEPPTRRGFGSRLIERSLAAEIGGTVTLEYPPDGIVCVMETLLHRRPPEMGQDSGPRTGEPRDGNVMAR
jgi:two-component sensor histidine kinase